MSSAPSLHYWQLPFARALPSVIEARQRLQNGWILWRLSSGYPSPRGAFFYTHAMTQRGRFVLVADTIVSQLVPDPVAVPPCEIDTAAYALKVPVMQRHNARRAGARWVPHLSCFAVREADRMRCLIWLPGNLISVVPPPQPSPRSARAPALPVFASLCAP